MIPYNGKRLTKQRLFNIFLRNDALMQEMGFDIVQRSHMNNSARVGFLKTCSSPQEMQMVQEAYLEAFQQGNFPDNETVANYLKEHPSYQPPNINRNEFARRSTMIDCD